MNRRRTDMVPPGFRPAPHSYVEVMDELDLTARPGLPDALRVLLERYPRPEWEAHPHFDGLIRFWIGRHLMFRRIQDALTAEARGFLDGSSVAPQAGRAIARLGNLYLGELEGHHRIEDVHYFPALARLEPRLERGFALLEGDHHRLDEELHRLAEDTNVALRAIGDAAEARDAMGRLEATLAGFGRFLDRHLVDEEELVVPVVLEHGPEALR